MPKLIAKRPILFLAHQYNAGDALPVSDSSMVQAWINAGSAQWENEIEKAEYPSALKARRVTAVPGITGISTTGNKEDLAGQIPDTPEREKPAVRKRQKK